MLSLRGGPELVALWAQLYSVIELVSGVALAGVGVGISVLVAQTQRTGHQRALLRESMRLGGAMTVTAMLVMIGLAWWFPDQASAYGVSPSLVTLSAVVGVFAMLPGMINGYWLGQQHRSRMLALALVAALLPVAAALGAPQAGILAGIALAHALPAVVAVFVGRGPAEPRGPLFSRSADHDISLLRSYVAAGVSIGLLSPASMLAARAIVSSEISWHDAGLLQALWRVSDWVGSIAAGIMSTYFLPRLSAAYGTADFDAELKRCARLTLIPAAVAFVILFLFQRPVFGLLYDDSFNPGPGTAALFFAGSLLRIASWVAFFALYAMRRTRAVTVGEFLSLPLFAALLALFSEGLTLQRAAGLWLVSYLAYGAFNLWALRRLRRLR